MDGHTYLPMEELTRRAVYMLGVESSQVEAHYMKPVSYTHLDVYKRQLVYRLDKLQKSTGLDLRVFEDCLLYTSRCV